MKPRTKQLLNFALIFGTLAIVLIIGFSGEELSSAVRALQSVGPEWLCLCLAAYAGYLLMDALSMHYYLKRQGYRITVGYALYVAIIGIYYCAVTPGATGGQPMQVYYLKKQEVPIGIGTSCLTVKYFAFQFMLMVVGTVLWIGFRDFVAQQLGGNMWILVTGFAYNAFSVCLVLLMAVYKPAVWFFIKLFIRVGAKLRLCKDPAASLAKWEDVLDTFHTSIMMLRKRPLELLVQLGIGLAQLLSLMAVTFFVYHAFGQQGMSYLELTTLGVLLYISASYTPLPGASGAQEGVFALYFAGAFPDGTRFMALLLWRFFTYYLSLIVGAITTVWKGFRPGKKTAARPEAEDPAAPH